MNPAWLARNLTPTSIAFESGSEATAGVAVLGQMVQGQLPDGGGVPLPTVMVRPAEGVSIRRLSSVARVRIVRVPLLPGVNV